MGIRGTFGWHELLSNEVEASVRFYTALFGWEIKDAEPGPRGPRRPIAVAGRAIGSVAPMDASRGVPCHWISDLTVDDVDAVAGRAAELGGAVETPPADLPGLGRTASIVDPWGASFRPVRPDRDLPEPTEGPPEAGRFCWNELLTPDPTRSGEFYRAICDWSDREVDLGDAGRYVVFGRGERDVAGMISLPPEGTVPPMWLLYVAVDDVDDSARRIVELGGRIATPPTVLPGIGTYSIATDATGATFAVYRPG